MASAHDGAKATFEAADAFANDIANLLSGRLRHVRGYRLAALKRELQSFDAQRKVWKS